MTIPQRNAPLWFTQSIADDDRPVFERMQVAIADQQRRLDRIAQTLNLIQTHMKKRRGD